MRKVMLQPRDYVKTEVDIRNNKVSSTAVPGIYTGVVWQCPYKPGAAGCSLPFELARAEIHWTDF
jgi:hypothetical protein